MRAGQAATADAGPPILLDVTRLVSRIGRGHPTGIDRVEAAWLGHLAGDPRHRLLCRTRLAQLVLPVRMAGLILRALGLRGDGQTEGRGAAPRGAAPRLMVEARLIAAAEARTGRDGHGLRAALAGRAAGGVYLNLGHANLSAGVLAAVPLPRVVLIHDVIPLDHPQWSRIGQPEAFRQRLRAALAHADLLLTVSQASAARLAHWRNRVGDGRRVPIRAVHIGTRLAAPDPAQPLPRAPWFLALGTIEPRKNHALLLDAWERMPAPPQLVIAGRRGWRNEALLARLDALPAGAPIREASDLSDGAVAALMAGAQALLFPSRAEGFGLPLTEAAARGLPILGLDLPSTREILADRVHYLPDDPAAWAEAVMALAATPCRRLPMTQVPGWPAHFDRVTEALAGLQREGQRG